MQNSLGRGGGCVYGSRRLEVTNGEPKTTCGPECSVTGCDCSEQLARATHIPDLFVVFNPRMHG